MEHFIKKALVATGLLAAALVTLLPLSSYAADSATTTVTVNVAKVIRLDAASGGDTIDLVANQVSTGNISAKVYSTMPYTISLSAASAAKTALQHATSPDYSIPASSNVTAGTNAWGIKKSGDTGYTAISTTPTVFYTGTAATPAVGTTTNFEVGISLGGNLAAGTYSTDVTVLAAFLP